MGSIGNKSAGVAPTPVAPQVETRGGYDIDEYAYDHGYDNPEDMILDNITDGNPFWTRDDEMAEDVASYGYEIIDQPNGEYFVIQDENDETESQFIVYYNTAGSSRYITRVRKA